MKTSVNRRAGFTLIELLVVIAVISILAAMIFPVTRGLNRQKIRRRASSELAQVQTQIDDYRMKLGHYPPDSFPTTPGPFKPWLNQLFYELKGTTVTNNTYTTLDGTAQITQPAIPTIFGASVTRFNNSSQPGAGDEIRSAANFLEDLRPASFMFVSGYVNGPGLPQPAYVLGTMLDGGIMFQGVNGGKINPWRYNSTSPTNNPSSYDLWVDVLIDGRTNRISNWSKDPIIVNTPY